MKKSINKIVSLIILLSIILSLTSFKIIISSENLEVQDTLTKSIEGLYVLKSCKKSRFSIIIKKTPKKYSFSILDKNKIISKGILYLKSEEGETVVGFGEIAGVFQEKNILVQNYGDAINHYIHFTQCGEKFLIFEKQKND